MFEFGTTKSVSTPFGAVVGQTELKEALLLVALEDDLGGLLIEGEKGTAKSTLVRGLSELLGEQRVVADCPYGCPPPGAGGDDRRCADCRERTDPPVETRPVPLVTLPLGATRDRVVGTLSVSDALEGETNFDPGLLAAANRGLLYVDEVNLLDDHLVDTLLDAAASGRNRVERDGVSVTHPAEFVLIGTMNPEEGDLRPQLRDRFGLSVEVTGEEAIEDRVAVIDGALNGTTEDDTAAYGRRLETGAETIEAVELTDDQKATIAEVCLEAGVDGHRGDIATARAARGLAALDGRPTVLDGDLRRAAELALRHRTQSRPFEESVDTESLLDERFDEEGGEDGEATEDGEDTDNRSDDDAAEGEVSREGGEDAESKDTEDEPGGRRDGSPEHGGDEDVGDSEDEEGSEQTEDGTERNGQTPGTSGGEGGDGGDSSDGGSDDTEEETAVPLLPGESREQPEPRPAAAPSIAESIEAATSESGGGRADAEPSATGRGATVRTERTDDRSGIDAAASVRAAATAGRDQVENRDLRRSVQAGDAEALVVFAVDASASMRPAMQQAKGVVLELLKDAYTERDAVSVVAFAGDESEVLLPPTDSVSLAARHLKELPAGDRTPLASGLETTAEVIRRADPEAAVVVLVSDGRANSGERPTEATREAAARLATTEAAVVCVDAGEETGLLGDVIETTDGSLVSLDALTAEAVDAAVEEMR
ncbi:MAG: VWA domain-containing protein [Natronomonas sp.]